MARADPDRQSVARRQRVVVVAFDFPVRSESFVVDHVRILAAAGFEVVVVAKRLDTQRARRLIPDGLVQFHALPAWNALTPVQMLAAIGSAVSTIARHAQLCTNGFAWRRAMNAWRLRRLLNALEPDLVHAHFGPNGVDAAIALSTSAAVRLIVDIHGFDATSVPTQHGWSTYLRTLSKVTVVAHSQFIESLLRTAGLQRISRVTMGVDQTTFRLTARPEQWQRQIRMVSVGRLVEYKGHDSAIRAMARLQSERPDLDVRLRIIGDGPNRESLRRLAQELRVGDRLDGPAPVGYEEMPLALQSADILYALSRRSPDGWEEAFCRSAAEAMACGTPVIANNCGGLSDTVGEGGVTVIDDSPETVACATVGLMEQASPATWAKRCVASAARFTMDQMRREYLEVSRQHVTPLRSADR